MCLRNQCENFSRNATDSDLALGGRRINDTTLLDDLDVA